MEDEDFTEQFRALVETRFQSEMGIMYPNIPIQWDDVTFKQPSSGIWAAITIMQNPAKRKSLGAKKFVARTTGFVQIDVSFHAESNLRVEAGKLANAACDIFYEQKFKGPNVTATFNEKAIMKAPAGGYGRFMARIFFYYDGFGMQRPIVQVP